MNDLYEQRDYVGRWKVGGKTDLMISTTEIPSRWIRFWNRVLIGWTWEKI